MVKRILVPLDGSKNAEQVLEALGQWIGSGLASEVILARVDHPTPEVVVDYLMPFEVVQAADQAKLQEARSYLDQVAARVDWKGVPHRLAVQLGDPGATLARLAEQEHVELVIAARPRRTGLWRFLRSPADEVADAFAVPVLVVSGAAAQEVPPAEGRRAVLTSVEAT